MPKATRDSTGLCCHNSTAALCIGKGRKSCSQGLTHLMIKHNVLLQVESIFSPVHLSQVMASQRSGAEMQHALHFPYYITVTHTPGFRRTTVDHSCELTGSFLFRIEVTEGKDDEALSEFSLCLTSSAESGGHPPHYRTPKEVKRENCIQ